MFAGGIMKTSYRTVLPPIRCDGFGRPAKASARSGHFRTTRLRAEARATCISSRASGSVPTRALRSRISFLTSAVFAQHARTVVAHHGERILAEIPTTLRRIGAFLLVLSISIPVFFAGLLVVLWHFAH